MGLGMDLGLVLMLTSPSCWMVTQTSILGSVSLDREQCTVAMGNLPAPAERGNSQPHQMDMACEEKEKSDYQYQPVDRREANTEPELDYIEPFIQVNPLKINSLMKGSRYKYPIGAFLSTRGGLNVFMLTAAFSAKQEINEQIIDLQSGIEVGKIRSLIFEPKNGTTGSIVRLNNLERWEIRTEVENIPLLPPGHSKLGDTVGIVINMGCVEEKKIGYILSVQSSVDSSNGIFKNVIKVVFDNPYPGYLVFNEKTKEMIGLVCHTEEEINYVCKIQNILNYLNQDLPSWEHFHLHWQGLNLEDDKPVGNHLPVSLIRTPMTSMIELGFLYNGIEEQLSSNNLWTRMQWENCKNCIEKKPIKQEYEKTRETYSKVQKMDAFQLKGDMKLSVLLGIVDMHGSLVGTWLTDTPQESDAISYSFVKTSAVYAQSNSENPKGAAPIEAMNQGFTHFVSSITYATYAMIDFTATNVTEMYKTNISAQLDANIKVLSKWDVDAHGQFLLNKTTKNLFKSIEFTYYGTIHTDKSPRSFQDVLFLVKDRIVPNSGKEEYCAPIQITLTPLTTLISGIPSDFKFRELSGKLNRKALEIIHKLQQKETFVTNSMSSKADWRTIISKLEYPKESWEFLATTYSAISKDLIETMADKLVKFRGKEISEIDFEQTLNNVMDSPLMNEQFENWKKHEVRELSTIYSLVTNGKMTFLLGSNQELTNFQIKNKNCVVLKITLPNPNYIACFTTQLSTWQKDKPFQHCEEKNNWAEDSKKLSDVADMLDFILQVHKKDKSQPKIAIFIDYQPGNEYMAPEILMNRLRMDYNTKIVGEDPPLYVEENMEKHIDGCYDACENDPKCLHFSWRVSWGVWYPNTICTLYSFFESYEKNNWYGSGTRNCFF